MKIGTILKSFFGLGLVMAIGLELGLFQRLFDGRSVVEDGVLGADFWIVEVDGKPVERIRHGMLVTKVPVALVETGQRVIGLSRNSPASGPQERIELQAVIEKGVRYRITTNQEGEPQLTEANGRK
jgi:hypothetical protein